MLVCVKKTLCHPERSEESRPLKENSSVIPSEARNLALKIDM